MCSLVLKPWRLLVFLAADAVVMLFVRAPSVPAAFWPSGLAGPSAGFLTASAAGAAAFVADVLAVLAAAGAAALAGCLAVLGAGAATLEACFAFALAAGLAGFAGMLRSFLPAGGGHAPYPLWKRH